MTESTEQELGSSRMQPRVHQPSATSTALGGNAPNQTRAAGEKRVAEMQKGESDTTSDKATAAFIRRTLCSHNVLLGNGEKGGTTPRPIDELLPPLTSSNEVDLQLYGIISVIIKEFVQTWYSKITPDHVFVNEVIHVIAHCTRALEQRLRKVDLEGLLLDEIPGLLEEHLIAFRLAKQQASCPQSLVSDPRIVYHTLYPHPALSPVPNDAVPSTYIEQRESESAWRQLIIQGVLAVLLPTDDLKNGCLRSLVSEIFAEMILGNGISGKACEGWLLWEAIGRIADVLQTDHVQEEDPSSDTECADGGLSRLERFGLLPSPAEEEGGSTVPKVGDERRHYSTSLSVSALFWTFVQYAFLACAALRAVILTIATSSSLPYRSFTSGPTASEESRQSNLPEAESQASTRLLVGKQPVVSMKLWSCAAQFLELDLRMPWLAGFISLLHCGALLGPGRVGDTDGVLDRYLSNFIHTRILNPALLPVVLRTARATLFPNNALGPPRDIPSQEETKEIKRRCAASLLGLLPPKVAVAFFANDNRVAQHQQVEIILECLEDTYLNKHLIFQILELIVLRLAPEMAEQSVQDLLEERIG